MLQLPQLCPSLLPHVPHVHELQFIVIVIVFVVNLIIFVTLFVIIFLIAIVVKVKVKETTQIIYYKSMVNFVHSLLSSTHLGYVPVDGPMSLILLHSLVHLAGWVPPTCWFVLIPAIIHGWCLVVALTGGSLKVAVHFLIGLLKLQLAIHSVIYSILLIFQLEYHLAIIVFVLSMFTHFVLILVITIPNYLHDIVHYFTIVTG